MPADGRAAAVGFKPLYAQVREQLTERIARGQWQPGELLPSETEIAAELGVSQGTVRKALDDMTAANLLVRRQGRGTYVARHDEDRILFRFFKVLRDDGRRQFPASRVLDVRQGTVEPAERQRLGLTPGATVIRIMRVRSLGEGPIAAERIVLPGSLFAALLGSEIPNNLYDLYANRFGITVAGAREEIKAAAASEEVAAALDLPSGTPVLAVDRVAVALDGRVVEWRLTHYDTRAAHYALDLR
jgi:GntR family transcriptional regulator